MTKQEKLIKEIGYEKTQLTILYHRIGQMISRLNELQINIDNGEFDND